MSRQDLTIPARVVAEGVGLPPVWLCRCAVSRDYTYWVTPDQTDEQRAHAVTTGGVELSNHQPAFDLALKLDEWERAGPPDLTRPSYATAYAELLEEGRDMLPFLRLMAARLTQVGMDHAIRRALGWLPPVGSPLPAFLVGHLETLRRHERGYWMMGLGSGRVMRFGVANDGRWAPLVDRPMPALAGITDPAEALAAIYEEVCGG